MIQPVLHWRKGYFIDYAFPGLTPDYKGMESKSGCTNKRVVIQVQRRHIVAQFICGHEVVLQSLSGSTESNTTGH